MRSIALIFTLFLFVSCAKTTDEKVAEAIDVANTYLSEGKCDSAIDVLEDVGRQSSNAIYLQVLASAYSCRAGFSELTFLLTDLDVMTQATTPTSTLLTYLSIISTSTETEADSDSYTDLKTAINLLIDSTSAQPSQSARNSKFGSRKAGDMGMQALLMMFAQLGKFLHYYGDVHPTTGAKGGGSASNNCFIAYTDATAISALGTGTCSSSGSRTGNSDLSLAESNLPATKAKLCEGLMLVTNIIDTLNNIQIPSDSTLSALDDIKTEVNDMKSEIYTGGLETLLDTTDQATCATLVAPTDSSGEFENLQRIYASLFEGGLP